MKKILKLLERDASLTPANLASMLNMSETDVISTLEQAKINGIYLGQKAVIDWDKTDGEMVTAFIDVEVTPQRGEGFDKVAERIYQFDEVESLYLMSGGHDLQVVITGRTLKEVALFVSEKLAPLEQVSGTKTHFLLKKYKEGGIIYRKNDEQQERLLFL